VSRVGLPGPEEGSTTAVITAVVHPSLMTARVPQHSHALAPAGRVQAFSVAPTAQRIPLSTISVMRTGLSETTTGSEAVEA
jgi:hypothetical protein